MLPYVPDNLPLNNINWGRLIKLISSVNYELARYEGILNAIVNPMVLLSPLTTKEAVLSSKIEGTQATLQEVLKYEAAPNTDNPKYHDIQEVLNYRKAVSKALDLLDKRPLSLNLIKDLHKILLDSVRGANKAPGEFRKTQNWIGPHNSTLETAYFVPPEPHKIPDYLSNFEKYIHSEEIDSIVQLAIIHAQFEIIHPFIDGNGRIGRILIPLFLYEKGLLSKPVFYMSEYFESDRPEYYKRLRAISETGDWNEWIVYFLTGFKIQAQKNYFKAKQIIELYETMKNEIHGFKTAYALPILDALFISPIFNTSDFTNRTSIPKTTANRILSKLIEKEILFINENSSGNKPNIYFFNALLDITEA